MKLIWILHFVSFLLSPLNLKCHSNSQAINLYDPKLKIWKREGRDLHNNFDYFTNTLIKLRRAD